MNLDSTFKILAHKKLKKYIKKNLPEYLKEVLDEKIKYLSENPYHRSLNTKLMQYSRDKLKELEADAIYEFYINMKFRCVFSVNKAKKEIVLRYVGNHDGVSNFLK